MSAPVIQPQNPSGGASLAPDAGFAGENIEHLSILDPLEALGIGSMTNRSRKKAQPKTTYYEYGGGYHAEPQGADYLRLVMPKQKPKSRKQASKKRKTI